MFRPTIYSILGSKYVRGNPDSCMWYNTLLYHKQFYHEIHIIHLPRDK